MTEGMANCKEEEENEELYDELHEKLHEKLYEDSSLRSHMRTIGWLVECSSHLYL